MGSASAAMRMFPLRSEEEVASFPLTKWKIAEPSEELVLTREDGVTEGDIDVVIVPGVAFDSSCNRLGHGRGHYGEAGGRSEVGLSGQWVSKRNENGGHPTCLTRSFLAVCYHHTTCRFFLSVFGKTVSRLEGCV